MILIGDEVILLGEVMKLGFVYDLNVWIISDVVCELGVIFFEMGIVIDDEIWFCMLILEVFF